MKIAAISLFLILAFTAHAAENGTAPAPPPVVVNADQKPTIEQYVMQTDYFREMDTYLDLLNQYMQTLTPDQKRKLDEITSAALKTNAAMTRLSSGYCPTGQDFDAEALKQTKKFNCNHREVVTPPATTQPKPLPPDVKVPAPERKQFK